MPPLPPPTAPLGTTVSTASWNGERAWSVIVYRRELVGWKQLAFNDPQTTSSTNRPYYSKSHKVYSPVIPRKGCIVLPALKQKWTLQNDSATGTVIRRGDKVLLRSQGRARVLMLQFTSLEECLSFSDSFVSLNPRHDGLAGTSATGLATANAAVLSGRQDDFNSQHSDPRQFISHPYVSEVVPAVSNPPASAAAVDSETDQRAINGMIARLLHDRDFLHFVDKIEQYILHTEDGSKMLQGLQGRELSQA